MSGINISNLDEDFDLTDLDKPLNIKTIQFINIKEKKDFKIKEQIKNILIKKTNFNNFQDPIKFINDTKRTINLLEKSKIFNTIILQKKKNNLIYYLNPKSWHFQSFSQNFSSSGKIGFSDEIGLRNIFKHLELLTFKYDKNIGGGNLMDFAVDFPIFEINKKLYDFKISAAFGDDTLYDDLYINKKNFCLNFFDQENFWNFLVKFQKRRFLFSPVIFKNYEYEDYLKNDYALDFVFSKKNEVKDENNFFHFISKTKTFTFSHSLTKNSSDLIFNFDIKNKFFLRKLLPFQNFIDDFKLYKMEIESNLFFNSLLKINQKKDFSLFNKKYYQRLRGFEKIDSNIPFHLKSQENNKKKINNISLSLLHTLKLNMLYFPQIENQNIFPFFHLTNIFCYDKKTSFKHYLSSGVGMEFKMNDYIGIEVLFNFFHLYKDNIFLNSKDETIQVRVSMGD